MRPRPSELIEQLARVFAEAAVDALLAEVTGCHASAITATGCGVGSGTGSGVGSAPSPASSGEGTAYAGNPAVPSLTGATGAGSGAAPVTREVLAAGLPGNLRLQVSS